MLLETITADRIRLDLAWSGERLAGIRLLWADTALPTTALSSQGSAMAAALARYASGQDARWPDVALADDTLTPFSRAVLATLRLKAPHGAVLTYGGLAALAGYPRAARAVGRAMAANRWPLLVPCHRVVGASGALTGFTGSGLGMKAHLLALEGIDVANNTIARHLPPQAAGTGHR
ncbi:MAG: methylated-DNA--[protein]-cysteine S-methyltransferase [Desulfovibrionaceae bacterium]